nr:MAG TPA: hypothetical protein [Caudoviricetes sp.]
MLLKNNNRMISLVQFFFQSNKYPMNSRLSKLAGMK